MTHDSPVEQGKGPYGCAFFTDIAGTALKLVEESEGDCAQYCKLTIPEVQTVLENEGFSSNGLVFGADPAEAIDYLPLIEVLPCMQDATACLVLPTPGFICSCHASLWTEFHDPNHVGVFVAIVMSMSYRFAQSTFVLVQNCK